jgi:hypothetical protein
VAADRLLRGLVFGAALAFVPLAAGAQTAPGPVAVAPKAANQGVAVVGIDGARDDAFALARAVYTTTLRPRGLDELRARVLAGDPAPPQTGREIRDLADVRASLKGGDDAASRRLLASVAEQLHVEALLVVGRADPPADPDAGAADPDGGAPAPHLSSIVARLYLVETGEYDAARYEPGADGWRATVRSISSRFPQRSAPVAVARPTPPPTAPHTQGDL